MPTTPPTLSPRFLAWRRDPDANKGDFGRVLLIAGSRGMSGAAVLCASAALRGGAGLVRLALPAGILPIAAGANPCYMTVPLPEDEHGRFAVAAAPEFVALLAQNTAAGLGPGLGRGDGVSAIVRAVLEQTTLPLVLDADGLNALPPMLDLLKRRGGPTLLTPHPGEFGRLIGAAAAAVQANRRELAVRFAAEHGVVLVLKGRHTIVSDGRSVYVNQTGNPGMATGGTGDVLTGLTAALLGQGVGPFAAAQLAVHLHGLAGDLARDALGETSLIATDLLDCLPRRSVLHRPPSTRTVRHETLPTNRFSPAGPSIMNLLCPNCQKPLSVPDQYAGQPMRCPLCNGTFTVPRCRGRTAPPPPPPPPLPSPPATAGAAAARRLRFPGRGPSAPSAARPTSTAAGRGPSPGAGMPPPPPRDTAGRRRPMPKSGRPTRPRRCRKATSADSRPGSARRSCSSSPPVALLLILALSFFAGRELSPASSARRTQNAWQAAIGWYSVDIDIGDPFSTKKDAGRASSRATREARLAGPECPPDVLPAAFRPDVRWSRWAAWRCRSCRRPVAARPPPHPALALGDRRGAEPGSPALPGPATVLGFTLENNFIGAADSAIAKRAPPSPTTPDVRRTRRRAGFGPSAGQPDDLAGPCRGVPQVLAIIGAVLTFLVNRRVCSHAAHRSADVKRVNGPV